MPAPTPRLSPSLCAICLRYLLLVRLGGLVGGGFAYVAVILLLGLDIPVWWLTVLGAGLVLYTLDALWHLSRGSIMGPDPSEGTLLREAVIDLVGLTAALYLTGGADNPLITLLLLPVTVAAATLQPRLIWGVTAVAAACYTALMFFHRAFPVPDHGPTVFALHVQGMWYGFILNAVLIAFFVAQMGAALRARDRELAQAREEALVENSPTGVFVLAEQRLVFVNPMLAQLLDYERAELIGVEALSLVDPRDRDRVALMAERRRNGQAVALGYECRLLTKSGQSRWVSLHNTLIDFRGGPATLGSVQDISERKRMETELHLLSARLLGVQEEERRRVARDLHDGICQTLTATRLALEGCLGAAPAIERRASMPGLRALVPALRGAVDEVRRISTDLRPAILDDLGLLATLRWFLGELKKIHPGFEVREHLDAVEEDIPDGLKTTIFRILQEATSNATKHGGGTLLEVGLSADAEGLRLVVADNGIGFVPGALPQEVAQGRAPGSGLSSMRERTELSGGVFRLRTQPGGGTRVEAVWWLDDEGAQRVTKPFSMA